VPARNTTASQLISQSGQLAGSADGGILVGSFRYAAGRRTPTHVHADHQLVWAQSGVLHVTTEGAGWVLPPTRAVWVPAGVPHITGASTPATLRSLYLPPDCPVRFAAPTAIAVDDLLAALIVHLARTDLPATARARAEAVIYDLVTPAGAGVVHVPMPRDPRALRLAETLVADPADARDLPAWGRHVGASSRTLARVFVAETGMSFARWRTHVRLRAALVHLADGVPVSAVAGRVGYQTPSAFVSVFRRTLGTTPGHYLSR
jgi:AraC-like DNA-binding protein/quercetin dioxygenase-like cupin family protein